MIEGPHIDPWTCSLPDIRTGGERCWCRVVAHILALPEPPLKVMLEPRPHVVESVFDIDRIRFVANAHYKISYQPFGFPVKP